MIGALNGLNVLVTRPQSQSENLAAHIIEQGANPVIFPTLAINPLVPAQGWDAVSNSLGQCAIAIFISANAVREVLANISLPETLQVAAIGQATALALSAKGLRADILPAGDFRSETLLALPHFAQVQGKRIVIFAGKGGRDFLEAELTARGALVSKIAVYQRYQPPTDPQILALFLQRRDRKIMIATSVESLSNLLNMANTVGDIRTIPLLVISERMRVFAQDSGFQEIVVASEPSNESLVNALKSWWT